MRIWLLGSCVLVGSLLPACAAMEDGVAAIGGRGGTIARSDEFTLAAEDARKLAAANPLTTWESAALHEAADLVRFVDDERVLVGHVEVGAYLGVPDFKSLTLHEARTGRKLWEAEREKLKGEYSVLAVHPLIVLMGISDSRILVRGLDPANGAPAWHTAFDSPLAHATSARANRVFILAGKKDRNPVQAIALDMKDGRRAWARELAAPQLERRPRLLLDAQAFYVVGRTLVRMDASDGRVEWSADADELGAEDGSAALAPDGVLVWNAKSVAFVGANGAVRWRHAVANGGIKFVSILDEQALVVVTPDIADASSGPLLPDRIDCIEMRNGSIRWSRAVGGFVVSMLARWQELLLLAVEDAMLGLSMDSGAIQFRKALPAPFHQASPTHYNPPGQPDLIHLGEGKAYLSRESAGIIAYALPGAEELWRHMNIASGARDYPYSVPHRVQRLKNSLAANRISAQGGSTQAGHFYRAQPNAALQSAQQGYDALNLRLQHDRGTALRERDAAVKERAAAQRGGDPREIQAFDQRIRAIDQHVQGLDRLRVASTSAQIRYLEAQQAFERAEAGLALAQAIVGMQAAVEQALKNAALQGLITKLTMEIQHAARLHERAFQGRYYLRPFVAAGEKARGVTVVDLETGKRSDLVYSPLIRAVSMYGVDLPQFVLDDKSERLVTVGVGLRPERYQPYVAWKVRLPKPSLLAYDLAELTVQQRSPASALRPALAQASPATGDEDFLDAARAGNLLRVRRLLDAGVDVNATSVHGHTALMIASDAGNDVLVRMLLQRGANAGLAAVTGETAMDYAANPAVRKLFLDAGADRKKAATSR